MKYIVFKPDTMTPHEFDTPQECEEFLLDYYKKKAIQSSPTTAREKNE